MITTRIHWVNGSNIGFYPITSYTQNPYQEFKVGLFSRDSIIDHTITFTYRTTEELIVNHINIGDNTSLQPNTTYYAYACFSDDEKLSHITLCREGNTPVNIKYFTKINFPLDTDNNTYFYRFTDIILIENHIVNVISGSSGGINALDNELDSTSSFILGEIKPGFFLTIPDRWLECNGQIIDAALNPDYTNLVSILRWIGLNSNTYFVLDAGGVFMPEPTRARLPDLRTGILIGGADESNNLWNTTPVPPANSHTHVPGDYFTGNNFDFMPSFVLPQYKMPEEVIKFRVRYIIRY